MSGNNTGPTSDMSKKKKWLTALLGASAVLSMSTKSSGQALRGGVSDAGGVLDPMSRNPTGGMINQYPSMNVTEPPVGKYDKYLTPQPTAEALEGLQSEVEEKIQTVKSIMQKASEFDLTPAEAHAVSQVFGRELQEALVTCSAYIALVQDVSNTQVQNVEDTTKLIYELLNLLDLGPSGEVAFFKFNTQAVGTGFYNNIAQLKSVMTQLPYKQGGGTDPSTALKIILNGLQAGTIKPTADKPLYIPIVTDGVIEGSAGAMQRTRDNMSQITNFNPNIKFLFLFVQGADGLDSTTMPSFVDADRSLIFTFPSPDAILKAIGSAYSALFELCLTGTLPPSTLETLFPTADPTKRPPDIEPAVLAGIVAGTLPIVLFPLVRKRQGFDDVDENEHKPALDLLNQQQTATLTAARGEITTQHEEALARYRADLAKWHEEHIEHARAAREAAAAQTYESEGPVERTGQSGFIRGKGDPSGGTGFTSGNIAYGAKKNRHLEAEPLPLLRRKPVEPSEPEHQLPDITNMLYVGDSTPTSLWAVTLLKGGFDQLVQFMKWKRFEEEIGKEALEIDFFRPISSLLARPSIWLTGDREAANNIGSQVEDAIRKVVPTRIMNAFEKSGQSFDDLLRWAAFSKAKRELMPGDVVQFVNGVPTSIVRRTDPDDKESVILIKIEESPEITAYLSKNAPTPFSSSEPNPIFRRETEEAVHRDRPGRS